MIPIDDKYEAILFCAAFCSESKYTFSVALDTAAHHGARLIILHIIEPRHRYSGILMTEEGDVCMTDDVIEKFKCKLSDFYLADLDKNLPCKIDFIVGGGIPWVEILRVARQEKVDHIYMGSSSAEASEGVEIKTKTPPSENAQLVSSKAPCAVSVVPAGTQTL